jgi:SNW domain-containing protein 1
LFRQNRRFVPDKEFSGTERAGVSRSGPVQFEKEENDPFGLDAFLDTAKRASKRNNEEDRRKEDRSACLYVERRLCSWIDFRLL